ncbi:hypothetical protein E0Z10_g1194 [Xylaria hypoxylon]|uniref:Uncharacterized protein n=1 Tax=Xylaria hypoxylon TaxID=37992 RepID=A0A4Z0YUC5_9PEZI|nr:hypothetical protein E0Z10_g1194 [Xylaria hypoxylon]
MVQPEVQKKELVVCSALYYIGPSPPPSHITYMYAKTTQLRLVYAPQKIQYQKYRQYIIKDIKDAQTTVPEAGQDGPKGYPVAYFVALPCLALHRRYIVERQGARIDLACAWKYSCIGFRISCDTAGV